MRSLVTTGLRADRMPKCHPEPAGQHQSEHLAAACVMTDSLQLGAGFLQERSLRPGFVKP